MDDHRVSGLNGPVMLGYIHGGSVRAEFMKSVLNILVGDNAERPLGGIGESTAGPLIAIARNSLTSKFLMSGLEWLWCVDTDIVFTPGVLTRLFTRADSVKRPIVSALYHVIMQDKEVPAMVRRNEDDEGITFLPTEGWTEGDMVQVDGIGAGCVLIHRDVFLRIMKANDGKKCWWSEIVINDDYPIGEDISFCLRASDLGIPIYVHTGVRVGHVKPITLGKVTYG